VISMTSNEQALAEHMAQDVSRARVILDEEEIISVIRGMREEIETLIGLISDEGLVVDNLFEILTTLSKPLKYVDVDLSLVPVESSEVEQANISYDGKLVIRRKDAGIQLINLMDEDNRDLLSKVLDDVLPKLMEIIKDPSMQPELEPQTLEPEPQPEPIVKDPIELEPVEVQESEIEPAIVEEPVIEQDIPTSTIEEPILEPEPEQVIPEVMPAEIQEPEPKPAPKVIVKKVIVEQLPKRGEKPLLKLRKKVGKQSDLTRKQMEIIKRVRNDKIKKLREEQENAEPEWVEENGIVSKVKKFFKKLGFR
jgi:hypothetical protein